jgi:hypothetical protein
MARRDELTDVKWGNWGLIRPLIPEPPRREYGRGRLWLKTCEMMNEVLSVLPSGARGDGRLSGCLCRCKIFVVWRLALNIMMRTISALCIWACQNSDPDTIYETVFIFHKPALTEPRR